MTPITPKEAAQELGCSTHTIYKAAEEGRLTKLPTVDNKMKLIKEQVMLFKGITYIRESSLPKDKKDLWYKYKDEAENPYKEALISQEEKQIQQKENRTISFGALTITGDMAEYMNKNRLSLKEETPFGERLFPYALADELDSKTNSIGTLFLAFAILLGLLALFFPPKGLDLSKGIDLATSNTTEIKEETEEDLKEVGIEKEEILTNWQKTIITLINHPIRTRRIQRRLHKIGLVDIPA